MNIAWAYFIGFIISLFLFTILTYAEKGDEESYLPVLIGISLFWFITIPIMIGMGISRGLNKK